MSMAENPIREGSFGNGTPTKRELALKVNLRHRFDLDHQILKPLFVKRQIFFQWKWNSVRDLTCPGIFFKDLVRAPKSTLKIQITSPILWISYHLRSRALSDQPNPPEAFIFEKPDP